MFSTYDYVWMGIHLLAGVVVVNRYLSRSILFFLFVFIVGLYSIVVTNGDLLGYQFYLENLDIYPNRFEYGFYQLSKVFSFISFNIDQIFIFYSLLIFAVTCLPLLVNDPDFFFRSETSKLSLLFFAFLLIQSVYFFLSSQNVIRQGLSLPLSICSVFFLVRHKYILSCLFLGFSILLHKAGLLFFAMLFFPSYFSRSNVGLSWGFFNNLILALIFFFIVKFLYGDSVYFNSSYAWAGNRSSNLVKFFSVGSYFLLLFFLLWRQYNNSFWFKLRLYSFVWVSVFVFSGELYARVLMIFYLVDLLFFLRTYKEFGAKLSIARSIFVVSSGFAPNILRLIV